MNINLFQTFVASSGGLNVASGNTDSPYFFLIIAAIAAIVGIASYYANEKRRKELTAFAEANGLSFDPDAGSVHTRYEHFDPFDRGHSRRSSNLISGAIGEIQWEMFDYRYTVGSGKNRRTYRCGIVAAMAPLAFPFLRIRGESVFDKMAAIVGFDDIDFESEEFSQRYHVKCEDRKAAYDLIHPQMMEYLLSLPSFGWQLLGPVILIQQSSTFSADALPAVMSAIQGFVERVPKYVRQDMATG